jgi:hypothetical protein
VPDDSPLPAQEPYTDEERKVLTEYTQLLHIRREAVKAIQLANVRPSSHTCTVLLPYNGATCISSCPASQQQEWSGQCGTPPHLCCCLLDLQSPHAMPLTHASS